MTKQEEIREGMAEKAHYIWQRWMAYMLTHLDDDHIERWKRQANTTYKDLPEHEKESDRSIADEYSKYLHSQDVMIKVDRELPENPIPNDLSEYHTFTVYTGERDANNAKHQGYNLALRDMLKAGYVAVEPLIEE